MPQPKSERRLGQGIALKSQAKDIIMNVFNKISEENPGMLRSEIQDRVGNFCGISAHAVRKVLTEFNKLSKNESFTTPGKSRVRIIKKMNIDYFQRCALRNTVYNFHSQYNKLPSLRSLLKVVNTENADMQLNCTHETLRKILRSMGFRWRKTSSNRKILIEKHDIRFKRINYLTKIQYYRQEGRPIVFSDETYIHSSHMSSLAWTDGYKKSLLKGSSLVIAHAGSEAGEIPSTLWIFKSGQKQGDFHDMNAENYEKWLKTRLIPNLPPHSVLVIDNAPYHNRKLHPVPNSNSKKHELLEWLQSKNIPCSPNMFKAELYELVKMNKTQHTEYYVDRLLQDSGHTVLRLPPNHPELNPIEMIWAKIKDEVVEENVSPNANVNEVKQMVKQKFCELSTVYWKACCDHSLTNEERYLQTDRTADMQGENFIITTNDSDSSEDSDDDRSDMEDADEIDPLL